MQKNNETTVNKTYIKQLKKTITIATIVSKSVNHRATWESTKEDSKSSSLDATRSTVAIEYLAGILILILRLSSCRIIRNIRHVVQWQ